MKQTKRAILYLILAVGAAIMVLPFIWMLLSSFKTAAEVNTTPPTVLPANPTFENYRYAFEKAPFAQYFLNSVIVTVACVAFTMFTSRRSRFRGSISRDGICCFRRCCR